MSSPPAPRKLFVTTALPYANGPFHIGHIMEYIQADIWVRFQRMQGHEVHFVCADDTHGAPIMLKAEEEGITPEQLIARVGALARRGLEALRDQLRHDALDALAGERRARAVDLPQAARPQAVAHRPQDDRAVLRPGQGHVPRRPLHQGHVPEVRHQGPVRGDGCEKCGTTNAPTDLDRSLFGAHRRASRSCAQSEHLFFRLSDPAVVDVPRALDAGDAAAARGVQQDPGVARRRRARRSTTGTSRATRPTSASRFPTRPASTSTCGSTRRSATSRR